MGLTERHWLENEEPELTDRQLEDIAYENKKAYSNGYVKGFHDAKTLEKKIVRCKDCQHQDDLQYEIGGKFVCRKGHGWNTNDFFCADGEPRKWKEGDGK